MIWRNTLALNEFIPEEEPKGVFGFFGEYRFLSNFWYADVIYLGIKFPTVEHAYQCAKIDPMDPEAAELRKMFASLCRPGAAKAAGRNLKRIGARWDEMKFSIMEGLLMQKFYTGELRDKLLATGELPLYEVNTWSDKIWGVVRDKEGRLEGENNLGKLLMKVRGRVR